MGKVRSFNLEENTRIGNYRVIEEVDRGDEGEVYKVAEVPTDAIRALKVFRTGSLGSIRHLTHIAWFFEQVRASGSVAIYFHWGQWFFDDSNGCWYLVFEFVDGPTLKDSKHTEQLFMKVAKAIARVHLTGYAVGDMSTLKNVIVRKSDGLPVIVDCNPGTPDNENRDFKEDCATELPDVAEAMFGTELPPRVSTLLRELKGSKQFSQDTLSKFVNVRR